MLCSRVKHLISKRDSNVAKHVAYAKELQYQFNLRHRTLFYYDRLFNPNNPGIHSTKPLITTRQHPGHNDESEIKGIRNLFELHNPNPEASFITPPPQDAIQFPGGDTFEYGDEYEIDVSEIYDDTPVTEGTVDATENPMSEDENLYVPTVKPGPKSKTLEPQPTNNESANLLLSGLNVPIYFIILICVGFGLFLWIAAWIGWSCRKCCQAQKDKDEKYIRNEIFGEKHRQQTDPLPIPDSGVIYKQQAGAALARIGDVASSQETLYYM